MQLLKVIGGVEQTIPVETQPLDVGHDRIDVFLAFFARIGVVKPKIAFSTVPLRQSKVQADTFRMPDMQVAVRFWRKTRLDRAPLQGGFAGEISLDFDFDKVLMVGFVWGFRWLIHVVENSLLGLHGR